VSNTKSETFQRVLARLLRPIARAMIAHGVTLGAATDALKRALFDAANEAALKSGKRTDSQISLMTGLHRKDVRRLKDEPEVVAKRSLLNATTLAVGIWTSVPSFCDKSGEPRPLAKTGSRKSLGFDDLVRTARIDLPVSTVLQALLSEGVVEQSDGDQLLRLTRDALLVSPDSQIQLQAYEKNLLAHLHAATHNLLTKDDDPRHYERAAHFNQLTDLSVQKLEKAARKQAQQTLEKLNKQALAFQDQDRGNKNARGSFSVGSYIFMRNAKIRGREE